MTREEFLKIIDDINNAKVYSIYDAEEVESFYNAKPVKLVETLDLDRHRWYEVSTTVYKIKGISDMVDWFIGLRGPSNLFSEKMDWEDAGVKVIAFEMEEVQSVTYKKKEKNNV